MRENCDACHSDYTFTRETTTAVLFVENPECNHLEATCPNCGNVERIYAMPDIFLQAVLECKLPLTLSPRADDALQERALATWGQSHNEVSLPDLPEAPKHLLRELYDDLRNWKGVME